LTPPTPSALARVEELAAAALAAVRAEDHEAAGAALSERAQWLVRVREDWPELARAPEAVREGLQRVEAMDREMADAVAEQRRRLRARPAPPASGGYREGFAPAAVLNRRA